MLRFLISRLIQGVIVIFAVLVITFVLMKAAPGGPFASERSIPEHAKAQLEKLYGLDQPAYVQLGRHVWNFVSFNWPPSYKFKGRNVGEIIAQGFPVSATIGGAALLIAIGIGVPLGALAALRAHTPTDRVAMIAATVGICTPSLVLGPLMAFIFGLKLGWFNVSGWYDPDDWVLPSFTLGIIYSAYISRITRGGLRETLSQDFIRTAKAKGVGEAMIVARHALKLACLPLLNYLGPVAAGLLTGSFVTETVFQVPGLGQHFIRSAENNDITLASATAAFYALLVVTFNLIVDFIQALLNPRIGFKP